VLGGQRVQTRTFPAGEDQGDHLHELRTFC
jgi:hypothetical protein